MFCPDCKVEYRLGFTRCSDCDVDLVEHLPDSKETAASKGQQSADLDAPELLWSGVDTGVFARIRAALEEAGILYNDEPLEARLLYASLRNPLEIWIQRADHDDARKIFDELFGVGTEIAPGVSGSEMESNIERSEAIGVRHWAPNQAGALDDSALQEEPEESPSDVADDITEDFDPEEATVEVWYGEDRGMGRIVKDCLRENGIGCVMSEDANRPVRILVQPQKEARAREIIREVTEGAPPE